jgi:hypothetical protein
MTQRKFSTLTNSESWYHRVVDLRCVRLISGNLVEHAPVGDF